MCIMLLSMWVTQSTYCHVSHEWFDRLWDFKNYVLVYVNSVRGESKNLLGNPFNSSFPKTRKISEDLSTCDTSKKCKTVANRESSDAEVLRKIGSRKGRFEADRGEAAEVFVRGAHNNQPPWGVGISKSTSGQGMRRDLSKCLMGESKVGQEVTSTMRRAYR